MPTVSTITATSTTNSLTDVSRVNGSPEKFILNSSNDTNGNASNGAQQPPPVPPRSFEKSFDDDFIA